MFAFTYVVIATATFTSLIRAVCVRFLVNFVTCTTFNLLFTAVNVSRLHMLIIMDDIQI